MPPEQLSQFEAGGAGRFETRARIRSATVLLVGKISGAGGEDACLVLNVSETGMMVRFTRAIQPSDRVEVEVRGLRRCAAIVRWTRGDKAGLEFERPQNVQAVITGEHLNGITERAPRFRVALNARLRFATREIVADVLDISPGGAKLSARAQVAAGEAAQLVLTGPLGLSLYGSVRWVDRDVAFGFHFSTPLPLAILQDCLVAGFAGMERIGIDA